MTQRAPDDWLPLELEDHHRQIAALSALLGGAPRRVLDLGSGDGRVAWPLHEAGHIVMCVDRDAGAIAACAAQGLETRQSDLLELDLDLTIAGQPPDCALLLGHTLLLLHQPLDALALFRRLASALAPGGAIVIDDHCESLWREVHGGAWQEGVSEDGSMQLLWAPGEPVFTLRHGEAVNADDWTIGPDERRMRLYSLGDLQLLAEGAGVRGPENEPHGALLVFRTPG